MPALSHHKRILAGILLISGSIVGFTGWMVWQTRGQALNQATLTVDSLAQALDHHAARSIEAVGLILAPLAERLEQEGLRSSDPKAFHMLLRRRAEDAPQIRSIHIYGADGAPLHDSEATPPHRPGDGALAAFAAHRSNPRLGLFVAPPEDSPEDGIWTMAVSRRIAGPADAFAGIVLAELDLHYFQSFYRSVRRGEGSVMLLTTQGRMVAREPFAAAMLDMDFADAPLFRDYLPRAPRGVFQTASPVDGTQRLISYRKLEDLPLVLAASMSMEEALAVWRENSLRAMTVATLLIAIALWLGLIVVREIRRRESAELETRSALHRLERQHAVVDTILKTLPDGVHLLDADLKLVGWNERMFEVMGVDRDEVLAAPDPAAAIRRMLSRRGEYGPGDPDALVEQQTRIALERKPVRYRRRQVNGRWMECRGMPVPGQGYLRVLRDVTEEELREAALRDANERLAAQAAELAAAAEKLDDMRRRAEAARYDAEQASRAKSAFLANMSHELRTPLNAINGFSEIIGEMRFGPDAMERYRDYARDIHQSGEHLLGLINSILDIAKIEAGRMELYEETMELGGCVATALRMAAPQSAARSVRLFHEEPPEPLHLVADEQKILQSLLNVLSNAIKFTPVGGSVFVAIERVPDEVRVTVRDTGIGIAREDQWKVFVPFWQVDSEMTRRSGGTGLGMPLTRSLIELHGGRTELESAPGEGTTVTLSLPIGRFVSPPLRAVG